MPRAKRMGETRLSRGRAARVVLAALALQVPFGLAFAWGAVVPLVRAQAHWPDLLLGAVFSGTPAGYGVGTVIGGRLADRLAPRRLCWASLGLLALGFAVAFAAPSGLTFVAAYAAVALGAGGGTALAGAVAALAQVLPGRAGTAGGLASATYAGSAIALGPLLAAAAGRFGWLAAIETVGAAAAVLAAALLLLMPALPPRRGGDAPAPVRGPSPAIWTGAALALCGSIFGTFAAVNLPAAVSVFAIGNAGGRLLGGALADRLGVASVLAVVFALELAAGLLLFHGGPVVPAAALAAGLGLGGDAGVLTRVGADAAPDRPNTAFGLVFAGFTIGGFSGPIVGALAGTPAAWLALAVPPAAGLALLVGRVSLSRAAAGPGSAPGR
jgi:MFS family permease